ncbi:unnamed protein product [uncultured virus]|nr:unnamed protein product [uncultured virus]
MRLDEWAEVNAEAMRLEMLMLGC